MSRSANHPHVCTIIRALDRAEESDRIHPGGAVRTTAAKIISLGETCEEFAMPSRERWTSDAARAVCMAYALNCPDDTLEWMADVAKAEIRWLNDWDRSGWYDFHGFDPPRTKRQARELDRQIAVQEAAVQ